MKLLLFNPSRDEALADGSPHYTPSSAARRLAHDWAELPVIYADAGDAVCVPADFSPSPAFRPDVRRVTPADLSPRFWSSVGQIIPWGWDAAVARRLERLGAPARLLPAPDALEAVRRLSSRQTAVELLPSLRRRLLPLPTVGESALCTSIADIERFRRRHPAVMLKAPWSCSGRGVWPVPNVSAAPLAEADVRRALKVLRRQGAIEVEPLYHRLADFAIEFVALPSGLVHYVAPSVFTTLPGGAYAANFVGSEAALLARLPWLAPAVFRRVAEALAELLAELIAGCYVGPLGVDLMFVRGEGVADAPLLHPCVEVNLRHTMGFTAAEAAKRKLNPADLPPALRDLWYFC